MTTRANRVSLGFPNENVQALLITQDGTANTAVNAITVPTGKFWVIKTAYLVNSDATARATAIQITDGTNVIATIAGNLITTNVTGVGVSFSGHCIIPSGWQIQGNTVAVSASTPVLQITGFEASNGLPSSAFGIT